MKKEILNRYLRNSEDKIIIDIAVRKLENLYNDFDRHAAYIKKELDQNFVDYLIDSANEIGQHDFIIQFRLNHSVDEQLTTRVKTSIRNYFLYLIALENQELRRMVRTSVILLTIGLVILFISMWINQRISGSETVISNVIAEGLNIAAWVSLWNAIATFLINWPPRRSQMQMYKRISKADIRFTDVPSMDRG